VVGGMIAFIKRTEGNPLALLAGVSKLISLGVVSKMAFFNA
jgi:hypothetical protein